MMELGSGDSFGESVDSSEVAVRHASRKIKVSLGVGARPRAS